MKRLVSAILVLAMLAGIVAVLSGCKKEEEVTGEQALEIYVWDAGYGTKWAEAMLADFAQQDWVKEKYPNLRTKLVANDQHSFAQGRLPIGPSNTIDLFFAPDLQGTFGVFAMDLSEVLYNSEVPGEDVLVKDKVRPYLLQQLEYRNAEGEPTGSFYSAPYSVGTVSYIYNATLFERLGLSVPRTTQELAELCETVKGWGGKNPLYPYTYTIISSQIAYSDRLTSQWWSQYEGNEAMEKFNNAIAPDGTRNSAEIFNMPGRLKVAEVYESIYKNELGYFDRSSPTYAFMQGQTRMLIGEGLIMCCGEWFSTEMRDLALAYEKKGYDFEMGMMKLPVISYITDRTPSILNDQMLREVISDIDNGLDAPSNSSVTAEDYEIVRTARGVISSGDSGNVCIPNYADGKEVAVDFLRYMATDRANAIYAENTYGGLLGYQFNPSVDMPELQKLISEYGKTYTVQADAAQIVNNEYANIPSTYSALVKKGNFSGWISKYYNLETAFMSDDNLTAEQVIRECNAYWLDNNAARFKTALQMAGLA